MTAPPPASPRVLFDAEADRSRQYLGSATTPEAAREAVVRALDEAGRGSTDPVARQAVELARLALGTLDAVKIRYVEPPPPRPRNPGILGTLSGLISGPQAEAQSAPVPEVVVSVDRMLASARDVLETAERLQKAAVPPEPVVVPRPWAQDGELVALLQDLLAGARRHSPEYLVKRVESLIDGLALDHEIGVVEFDGTNRSFFDVVPAAGPDETTRRTVTPALVHRGQLLRAGEARESISPRPEGTTP